MAEAQNTAALVLEIARGFLNTENGAQFVRYYNQLTGADLPLNSDWCACFVTYIMRTAGVPVTEIPNYASCTAGMNQMKKLGTFRDRSGYTPKPGDVILFDWDPSANNGPDHTGIVENVVGGRVYTIEGNAGKNGICLKQNYVLNSSYITGYGVPSYKTGGDDSMSKADFEKYYNEINPLYKTLADVPAYWQTDTKVLIDLGGLKGTDGASLNIRKEELRPAVINLRLLDKRYNEVNELPEALQEEVQALVDKGKIKGQNGTTLGGMTYSTIRAVVIANRPDSDPEKAAENG